MKELKIRDNELISTMREFPVGAGVEIRDFKKETYRYGVVVGYTYIKCSVSLKTALLKVQLIDGGTKSYYTVHCTNVNVLK